MVEATRQLGVHPQQLLRIRPRTRTAAARLDPEDVVEQRANEVEVQVEAAMAHLVYRCLLNGVS